MTPKRIYKILGITILSACIISILIVVVYNILLFAAFGAFDKYYNTNELIAKFNSKSTEINSLKSYFKTITPKYKRVDIEIDDDEIAHLVISPIDTGIGSDLTLSFQEYNTRIYSAKADSLLLRLGWDREKMTNLQNKLKDADCISIGGSEPTKIGFKRSGMGMYFFDVFDKPIPDSLKARYNDSCTYVYANKKLILEFGGGAIGSQCFFNKQANH